jgi:hypothetical protein
MSAPSAGPVIIAATAMQTRTRLFMVAPKSKSLLPQAAAMWLFQKLRSTSILAWGAKLAQGCGKAATYTTSRHSRADTLARIVELQGGPAIRFPFEIKPRYHQPGKGLDHYGHQKRE